jgi:hypothetical protein
MAAALRLLPRPRSARKLRQRTEAQAVHGSSERLLGSGEFRPLSTTVAAVTTGAATAGTLVSLTVRTAYVFQQDGPGTSTLPLVLTTTAP